MPGNLRLAAFLIASSLGVAVPDAAAQRRNAEVNRAIVAAFAEVMT